MKMEFGAKVLVILAFVLVGLGFTSIALGEEDVYHSADTNQDGVISQEEYERVEDYFNAGGYHCDSSTVDGYAPNESDVDYSDALDCNPHDSDYEPQNWKIELSELLRVIQFHNVGGYTYVGEGEVCDSENVSEDGFCPQASVNGGEDLELEVGINQNVFNVGERAVLNIAVAGGQGPYAITILTPFGGRTTHHDLPGSGFTVEDWLFYDSAGQQVDFIIRVIDNTGETVVYRQTVAINR
ncbi:MAG: hypothetical protein ACOCU8_00965 [Patescibacteria group bacterium]